MRLAVVAQQASPGGGTRFLRPLILALASTFADIEITMFVNSFAADTFGAGSGFGSDRISIAPIDPNLSAHPASELVGQAPVAGRRTFLQATGLFDRRSPLQREVADLARALDDFDVAYLAWPYFLHPMIVDTPLVGTFHDFNYKHSLGTLGPEFVTLLDDQIGYWLEHCSIAISSAQFIADEMREFYSVASDRMRVVRLSTLLADAGHQPDVQGARSRHGVPDSYLICPSNTSRHKNLERLLRAHVRVRAAGGPPLVLIGNGTTLFKGLSEEQSADPTAVLLHSAFRETGLELGKDVFTLGYVNDSDADALIAGAELLVAPSRYEAGSGPALDAWALGTPVAMSAIPPFLEHLDFLGVRAATFDPEDEGSIAEAIVEMLARPDAARDMARESKAAIARYTWADVAKGYREAFDAAVERGGR